MKLLIAIYLFVGFFEAVAGIIKMFLVKKYTNIQTYIAGFILKMLLWPLPYLGGF